MTSSFTNQTTSTGEGINIYIQRDSRRPAIAGSENDRSPRPNIRPMARDASVFEQIGGWQHQDRHRDDRYDEPIPEGSPDILSGMPGPYDSETGRSDRGHHGRTPGDRPHHGDTGDGARQMRSPPERRDTERYQGPRPWRLPDNETYETYHPPNPRHLQHSDRFTYERRNASRRNDNPNPHYSETRSQERSSDQPANVRREYDGDYQRRSYGGDRPGRAQPRHHQYDDRPSRERDRSGRRYSVDASLYRDTDQQSGNDYRGRHRNAGARRNTRSGSREYERRRSPDREERHPTGARYRYQHGESDAYRSPSPEFDGLYQGGSTGQQRPRSPERRHRGHRYRRSSPERVRNEARDQVSRDGAARFHQQPNHSPRSSGTYVWDEDDDADQEHYRGRTNGESQYVHHSERPDVPRHGEDQHRRRGHVRFLDDDASLRRPLSQEEEGDTRRRNYGVHEVEPDMLDVSDVSLDHGQDNSPDQTDIVERRPLQESHISLRTYEFLGTPFKVRVTDDGRTKQMSQVRKSARKH